jgi:hypothetical protein
MVSFLSRSRVPEYLGVRPIAHFKITIFHTAHINKIKSISSGTTHKSKPTLKSGMNDRIRRAAIAVMNQIAAHPAANDFLDPFQPSADEPDYFEKITDPQDISTIKARLASNEYTSVQQWLKDVDTVWSNAITYKGEKSDHAAMAVWCRQLFAKYKRSVDVLTIGTWCRELYRLRSRVYDLMALPPVKVKQYASASNSGHGSRQTMTPLTEAELQSFVAAGEMLSDEEHAEMIRVIEELDPEFDSASPDLVLDVTTLNLRTIYALRDFMKTALEKRGQKYPE